MRLSKTLRLRLLCTLIGASLATMLPAQRHAKTLNDGWEFRLPSHQQWSRINLPHTYNLDAYDTRAYYQGQALYRRTFRLPQTDTSRRYYLRFDAASKAADVTLNGRAVGSHAGGYTAFTLDVTDCIQADNVLEVSVDNSRQDIPPISADFTFWGGIYRDVWLISVPQQHFVLTDCSAPAVRVTTPEVSHERAVAMVSSNVANDAATTARLAVRHSLYDPQGQLIQTHEQSLKLKAGERRALQWSTKPIAQPALWSPESPSLYTLRTQLIDPRSGQVLDEQHTAVGFRWFEFSGQQGFMLNGKPYKLRGVNRHQDQAPVGVALDDEAHRRDVRLMKDIGCNFIRISHYPQDDALLDACDRLGLLAWEEIPVVNIVEDTPGYGYCCEQNLREMVRQHFNHPSIIIWGYMNEILLVTPGPDKPSWPAYKERTVALAQRLEKALKEEDNTRHSAMAYNMTRLYYDAGLDVADIDGWNLYQGWYVDKLADFDAWCLYQHEHYPDRPIIISEWGAGSDRRLHAKQGKAFDFSIEYHQTYTEHYLPFIEKHDWISGCAYWNFVDFNSAGRQESMPRVNNKGLFYNDRTPKDIAYYFKAMWRQDTPMLHIATRDYPVRTDNTDNAQAVKIYTNLDEVTLFVNGEPQGTQPTANCQAIFHVKMPAGTVELRAEGTRHGQGVSDVTTITMQPLPCLAQGDELAINVGSNCAYIAPVSGLTWLPDQAYTEGGWGHMGGQERSTTSEITETVDVPLYQTWREGDFYYAIDAPAGQYEVELLCTDVSRPAAPLPNLLGRASNEQPAEAARFDIIIAGRCVEHDFSPADGGRYRTACRLRHIISHDGGQLTIKLQATKGKPALSGIKVRKV